MHIASKMDSYWTHTELLMFGKLDLVMTHFPMSFGSLGIPVSLIERWVRDVMEEMASGVLWKHKAMINRQCLYRVEQARWLAGWLGRLS